MSPQVKSALTIFTPHIRVKHTLWITKHTSCIEGTSCHYATMGTDMREQCEMQNKDLANELLIGLCSSGITYNNQPTARAHAGTTIQGATIMYYIRVTYYYFKNTSNRPQQRPLLFRWCNQDIRNKRRGDRVPFRQRDHATTHSQQVHNIWHLLSVAW